YRTRFSADYVARPTVGYSRDNFGNGFFGGSAISLSDILGNHTLVFAAAVNGRLVEAQVLAAYVNQTHRINWLTGFSQQPYYYYLPTTVEPNPGASNTFLLTPQVQPVVLTHAVHACPSPRSSLT